MLITMLMPVLMPVLIPVLMLSTTRGEVEMERGDLVAAIRTRLTLNPGTD